jgi:hypothetical protein
MFVQREQTNSDEWLEMESLDTVHPNANNFYEHILGFHCSDAEDSCLLTRYAVSIGSYRRFESITI